MAYQDEGGGFRAWINEGIGKVVVITVVVLLVCVAGVYGYRKLFRERGSAAARRAYEAGQTVRYVCDKCGDTGKAKFPYDVKWPAKCPKCGEMAAWPGFPCKRCKKMIKNTGAAQIECPYCHYVNVIPKVPGNAPPPPPMR